MEEINSNSNTTTKTTDGVAIAALVLGILSLILGWTIVLGIVCGIISIILGIIAIANKNKPILPVIGFILSGLGIMISIVIIILFSVLSKNVTNNFTQHLEQIENILNNNISKSITGKSWEASDGSLLVMEDNGDFKYYKDKEDLEDYYFEGKYKIYTGEDAIQYIDEDLEEYGVTEQEQRDIFERNEKYTVDNYICIVLTNEKCVINGENTLDEDIVVPYFGFYYKDEKALDIANMNTATYYYFMQYSK